MFLRIGVRFHLFELTKIIVDHRELCNSDIIILIREDAQVESEISLCELPEAGIYDMGEGNLHYMIV